MPGVDNPDKLTRRDFVGQTAAAAGAVAVAAGSGGALAQSLQPAPPFPGVAPTLTLMARDLYPHDHLPDAAYGKAVNNISADLAADPVSKTLLVDGATALNRAAQKLKGRHYVSITLESDRVAVLKTMQGERFFKAMRAGMVTAELSVPGSMPFRRRAASA
jgi:hypothetical protein